MRSSYASVTALSLLCLQCGDHAVQRDDKHVVLDRLDPSSASDADHRTNPARIAPALVREPTRRVDRPDDVRAAVAQRLGLDHESDPRRGAQHVVEVPAPRPVHRVPDVPALARERLERPPYLGLRLGAHPAAPGQAQRSTTRQDQGAREQPEQESEHRLAGGGCQHRRDEPDRRSRGA
jgi:hypothetical protein